jgi:uncharacterized membrane protein YeiH
VIGHSPWAPPFAVIDLIGVFANAVPGGAIARREGFDPIGSAVLAMLSGLGGGVIRDTILQAGPPAAFSGYTDITAALAGGAAGFLLPPKIPAWRLTWPIVDAVALGAWATAGALKAVADGFGWLPATVIGRISAVGGGMVRDIVVRRTPSVLGGNTLYASCAVVAAVLAVAFERLGLDRTGPVIAALAGTTLCVLARWRGWVLPSRSSSP